MTISRRLAAHRQANASAGVPSTDDHDPETMPDTDEDDDLAGDKPKKKDTNMTDTEHSAALAAAKEEGRAEGAAATHKRYSDVMASDHYAGREKLALALLGNDKLSAGEVITALQAADKVEPTSAADTNAAAEDAARAEMQAALRESANSQVDASGGGGGSGSDKLSAKDRILGAQRAFGGGKLAK